MNPPEVAHAHDTTETLNRTGTHSPLSSIQHEPNLDVAPAIQTSKVGVGNETKTPLGSSDQPVPKTASAPDETKTGVPPSVLAVTPPTEVSHTAGTNPHESTKESAVPTAVTTLVTSPDSLTENPTLLNPLDVAHADNATVTLNRTGTHRPLSSIQHEPNLEVTPAIQGNEVGGGNATQTPIGTDTSERPAPIPASGPDETKTGLPPAVLSGTPPTELSHTAGTSHGSTTESAVPTAATNLVMTPGPLTKPRPLMNLPDVAHVDNATETLNPTDTRRPRSSIQHEPNVEVASVIQVSDVGGGNETNTPLGTDTSDQPVPKPASATDETKTGVPPSVLAVTPPTELSHTPGTNPHESTKESAVPTAVTTLVTSPNALTEKPTLLNPPDVSHAANATETLNRTGTHIPLSSIQHEPNVEVAPSNQGSEVGGGNEIKTSIGTDASDHPVPKRATAPNETKTSIPSSVLAGTLPTELNQTAVGSLHGSATNKDKRNDLGSSVAVISVGNNLMLIFLTSLAIAYSMCFSDMLCLVIHSSGIH
ncbi:mucin-3A-like [Dermacentor silvarum]|uniref:mucin-3A-like n=1 Tax=Dermacentor silvarum TaxID=543639 RepID=UPI002101CBD9|nr:mucin-3A-like [Dermacentor silvarum]